MRRRARILPGSKGRLTLGDVIVEAWTALRYAAVGSASAVVYIVTAIVLERAAQIGPLVASTLGYTAAAVIAYAGHHSVTFGADGRHGRYVPRFLVLVVIGYGVSLLLPKLLVERHLTSYPVATLAVVTVNAAVGYLINRTMVFGRAHRGERQEAPADCADSAGGAPTHLDEAITLSSSVVGGEAR